MSEDLDFIGKGEGEKWVKKTMALWSWNDLEGPGWPMEISWKLQLLGHSQETKEMGKLSEKYWFGWEGIEYHYSSF